ncbi:phage holin family protein [Providencia vermicola]
MGGVCVCLIKISISGRKSCVGYKSICFLSGVTLATFIAFVRERREGNTTRQSFAEAVLCGVLTVGAIRAL